MDDIVVPRDLKSVNFLIILRCSPTLVSRNAHATFACRETLIENKQFLQLHYKVKSARFNGSPFIALIFRIFSLRILYF